MSACIDFSVDHPGPRDPRLLDRACDNDDSCGTAGNAQRTTGITEDSVGYRLGPGSGSLRVPLERKGMGDDFTLELLVAGNGNAEISLEQTNVVKQSLSLSDEYEWAEVEGRFSSYSYDPSGQVELTIQVDNDSKLDLADLRAKNLDYVSSCSVAAVGRR